MPQLNHISAEVAKQLLIQQQQSPKFQPADLGTLINFSQILGGLITPSETASDQMTGPVQDVSLRPVTREKVEALERPEPVREFVRADDAGQRDPIAETFEGPERRTAGEPTTLTGSKAPEVLATAPEQVVLAQEGTQVLMTGVQDVQATGFEIAVDTPIAVTEGDVSAQLFEPEAGATQDIVAQRIPEVQVEQKQEMIDFLSGRSLGMKQMASRAPAASEQTLEQVMPEVTASQAAELDGKAVPEFRPLVPDSQAEQNAQASPERMTVTESQVRQNLAAAKTVLFEEAVAEQNNAPAQNPVQPNPSAYISQLVARVEVPVAEVSPSPAAVAAASEAEGVPGVRSAQAAEGAPTMRQEAVRVNQAEIIERIVRLTKAGVNKGRQEVRLVLNPPELGGMKIHLKVEHGTLDATIRTDTANAQQLVSANLAELRNGLIEAGLDVGFIEVLLTGEEARSGHFSSFEEHLNEHGAGADSNAAGVAASDMEPALASAPSLTGMSLIDITV
ncbi:MAG: flagellar hook-length control protein FliK [Planctomycetota bacterium]|jgi:hypothetical protein